MFYSLLLSLFVLAGARKVYLPPSVQIEGVAHAAGSNYFVSDIRSSAVFLVDIDSALVTTVVPPAPNRTALGLYASRGRLFVARGGNVGFGSGPGPSRPLLDVYDIAKGTPIASCPLDARAAINDVVADRDFAFYTDSLLPFVYKLHLANPAACQIDKIRLPRPFVGGSVPRANGIVKYKKGLIVVNFELSTLYFIDLLNANKAQRLLRKGRVPGADGLEIRRRKGGSLLFVTQVFASVVSVWKLSIDDRKVSARFMRNVTSPEFEEPTTVALSGRTLVAANSRFGTVPPNETIPENFRSFVSSVHV